MRNRYTIIKFAWPSRLFGITHAWHAKKAGYYRTAQQMPQKQW